MIKLFTLENLSAFSSDAVYKICLSLDAYGVSDESICTFESYEKLLSAVKQTAQNGDCAVIAVEKGDYTDVKHILSSVFMLEEVSSPALAEAIAQYSDPTDSVADLPAQCTVPKGSVLHISDDGLYSGFTCALENGLVTMIPLDFSRIDTVLESYISSVLTASEPSADEEPDRQEEAPAFSEAVSKMVYSLMQVDKRVALATSEATMWIYELYDKIDGLSEVMDFVEIIDEEDEEAEKSEEENQDGQEDATDSDSLSGQDGEESADENGESDDEAEKQPQQEKESASARIIRHAREAMANMNTDFGAAISEVYCTTEDDGSKNYYAFVAVSDKNSTKAKKINTKVEEEASMLLPHCVTVLAETVCQKVDTVSLVPDAPAPQQEKKFKIPPKGMIAFAAIILLVAIISPILIVNSFFKNSTTTQPQPVIATGDVVTTTSPYAETTASLFPGITDATTADPFTTAGSDATTEPPATEVTVATTTPNVSSTSGTFTFYVFGYGHGVGMSQTGANYLASLGWNYAQILANYYYGATLVSGDTYPQTIKYNGTDYNTRDYLAGVLEGEMGSSFLPEALKAQAVAAYTFAKYYGFELGTDSNAYSANASQACYAAVDEVMKNGLYIAYGGQTALTPFHSTSAGITTSYYNAWGGTALPYLSGGRPSYGDYNAADFKSTFTITSAELKTLIESKNLGITLSGDPATWLSVISHDAAVNSDVGYVSSINVGGKIMSGNEFRIKVMEGKIRSHCFMIVYTPNT